MEIRYRVIEEKEYYVSVDRVVLAHGSTSNVGFYWGISLSERVLYWTGYGWDTCILNVKKYSTVLDALQDHCIFFHDLLIRVSNECKRYLI